MGTSEAQPMPVSEITSHMERKHEIGRLRRVIALKLGSSEYESENISALILAFSKYKLVNDDLLNTLQIIVSKCEKQGWSWKNAGIKKPDGWKKKKKRRLAADPSALTGNLGFLLLAVIPLLFLVYMYWFFSRRFQIPAKRSRKQSTYRCHYPENAEDFSDVEPEID